MISEMCLQARSPAAWTCLPALMHCSSARCLQNGALPLCSPAHLQTGRCKGSRRLRLAAEPEQSTQTQPRPNRETRRRVRQLAPDMPPQQLASGQEVKPEPQPQLDSALFFLPAGLFALVFVEGILLAVSGFLPQEADQLVTSFVYPAALPTLVAFLASSVFLLLKAKQAENEAKR